MAASQESERVLLQVLCKLHHGDSRDERCISGSCLPSHRRAAAKDSPEDVETFCMAWPEQHNRYTADPLPASLVAVYTCISPF